MKAAATRLWNLLFPLGVFISALSRTAPDIRAFLIGAVFERRSRKESEPAASSPEDRSLGGSSCASVHLCLDRPGEVWDRSRSGMDSNLRQDRIRRLVPISHRSARDRRRVSTARSTDHEDRRSAARELHGGGNLLSYLCAGRPVFKRFQSGTHRRNPWRQSQPHAGR